MFIKSGFFIWYILVVTENNCLYFYVPVYPVTIPGYRELA
jgi:hypothetical protein